MHSLEGDAGVGPRALRRRGNVVASGGVAAHDSTERGGEGVPEGRAMVFVVDVKAVDDCAAKGSHLGAFTVAGAEEIPKFGCKVRGLRVAGEGCGGLGAAETEEDFFAETLTGFDVVFHGRAAEKTGSAGGPHFLRGTAACGAEVDTWVSAGCKERCKEG